MKKSLLLCLLLAGTARGESPIPRILCNGVFQGFPASLNFQGATSCAGIGGVNAVTVTIGSTPAVTPATATALGGLKGNGTTTICSGTDKMTGWDASGAMICAAGASGAPTDAQYWTGAADATLSAEKNLGALGTALVVNTGGVPSAYSGATCSANQYMTALNAVGAKTCSQVSYAQVTGTPTLYYQNVQGNGGALTQRPTLNIGGFVACADDGAGLRTTCNVLGDGGHDSVGTPGDLQMAAGGGAFSNFGGSAGCPAGQFAQAMGADGAFFCSAVAYANVTGTPTNLSAEPFITKTASANLSNEFALGSLATGLLKNTTVTGVPTIAAAGTDYAAATSGSVILLGNGAGGFSNYAGAASCTNQFFTGLSSTGASTCTTDTLASAQHANQGTTTQVLHGNAAGNPSWAAVTLTTDVTGVLPLANGGTNNNITASNGAFAYSDASKILLSSVGTAGQAVFSGGAGAPTFSDAMKVVRLTADYTNATTTLSNTALTWTSPAVVSRSAFDCMLMVKSSAATTGGQFDVLNGTAPTTITYELQYVTAAGTAPSTGGTKVFVTSVAGSTLLGPAATSLTTYTLWRLTGIIVHTSTASAVTIRGKAGAAGTLTVGSGSYCQYYAL
jgi:hypothetical protein